MSPSVASTSVSVLLRPWTLLDSGTCPQGTFQGLFKFPRDRFELAIFQLQIQHANQLNQSIQLSHLVIRRLQECNILLKAKQLLERQATTARAMAHLFNWAFSYFLQEFMQLQRAYSHLQKSNR